MEPAAKAVKAVVCLFARAAATRAFSELSEKGLQGVVVGFRAGEIADHGLHGLRGLRGLGG